MTTTSSSWRTPSPSQSPREPPTYVRESGTEQKLQSVSAVHSLYFTKQNSQMMTGTPGILDQKIKHLDIFCPLPPPSAILFTDFRTVFGFWTTTIPSAVCNFDSKYNGDVAQKFDSVPLNQSQRVWAAFCKIFLGIPHLTIFGSPKYAQKIQYLAIFGRFWHIRRFWARLGQWDPQSKVITESNFVGLLLDPPGPCHL